MQKEFARIIITRYIRIDALGIKCIEKFYAIQECSQLLMIQFKWLEMLKKFCIFQFTKTFVIHYNRKNIRRDHILTYWKETWWIDKILMWIVHFVRDGLQNYNRTFKSGLKWKKISLDERFWIALQSFWSCSFWKWIFD